MPNSLSERVKTPNKSVGRVMEKPENTGVPDSLRQPARAWDMRGEGCAVLSFRSFLEGEIAVSVGGSEQV